MPENTAVISDDELYSAVASDQEYADRNLFQFQDDFYTTEDPVNSPRTTEPGGEEALTIDTNNVISIAGERLTFNAGGPNLFGDPAYYGAAQTRNLGLAMLAELTFSVADYNALAWHNFQSGPATRQGIYFREGSKMYPYIDGSICGDGLDVFVNGVSYKFAFILRTTGAYIMVKGGIYSDWRILWIDESSASLTLYPSSTNSNPESLFSHDFIRVSQLAAPWIDDFGIVTDRNAGVVTDGADITAEADHFREIVATTIPGVGEEAQIKFRMQDSNNYWEVAVNNAGDLILREIVGGTPTQQGISSGVITNGNKIRIRALDDVIKVYDAKVIKITKTGATNFMTETQGERTGDGTFSDDATWPITVSGSIVEELDLLTT